MIVMFMSRVEVVESESAVSYTAIRGGENGAHVERANLALGYVSCEKRKCYMYLHDADSGRYSCSVVTLPFFVGTVSN